MNAEMNYEADVTALVDRFFFRLLGAECIDDEQRQAELKRLADAEYQDALALLKIEWGKA